MTDFRKISGLGIAAAMLVGSLAACGSSSASSDSTSIGTSAVKLTVWAPQEDQQNSSSWLPTLEASFEKAHPEYKITWKNSVVSEGDAGTTVKQDPSAAADVYMFSNDQLGTLVSADAIGELSDSALAQVKSQNTKQMITSVTQGGKVYGVPYTGNTWFMYYNKSKFSSSDVKSFDSMLQKGKVSFPITNSWYMPAFYLGNGNTLYGKNGTNAKAGVDFSGTKASDVTKYLVGLSKNSNFVSDANGSGLAGLGNGSVDVLFSGSWDSANVKKALGDNYAAAQLPTYDLNGKSIQMESFAGSKAVAYNPNTKYPQAASEFAAYLGSAKAQKLHYTMRGIIPADQTLLTDKTVAADPVAVAQNDTINNTSILQPTVAAMSNFWTPAENFGKAIMNGDVTAANAVAKTEAWNAAYASSN
ncbi:extracellular solute-binding protein [Bifidobacterium fermentum]|uniref:Extracellular solute-binding protein n=1 Tax=Bifidobacterium fermentum TaxID=3059035 RepID=A0AB39UHP2_9BIFI